MIALLAFIFWLTIAGADVPSQWLSSGLFWVEERLADFFSWIGAPSFVCDMLVHGAYRTFGLGRFGNAAANGDLFPVVYSFWKIWAICPGWRLIWTAILKNVAHAASRA